jgi:hypothetical protein
VGNGASLIVRLGVLSMLALCTARTASAQFNSDNCTVSVLNRSVLVNTDGSWVLPNIPANFGLVRARVTCIVDGQTISGESDPFLVPANGVINLPHITFGATTPIPTSLALSSAPPLTQSGATAQITATAKYGDGSTKDVTAASTGTQYTISNSAIATISADGVVTAVQSGTVLVQATQEGASGIVSIQVAIGGQSHGGIPDSWLRSYGLDPNDPTIADQDPDRDGLTNLQEFQLGTNPINPDTDSDGLSDGDEVNKYHTNPLLADTDGDRIPDGIEIQTGTDPLDPKSYDLRAATAQSIVKPASFKLTTSVIMPIAAQELSWKVLLIDGRTTLDLTTDPRTAYNSSDLTICNFGGQKGIVFAGSPGSCSITLSQNTLSVIVPGSVVSFTPTPLSFVDIPGFANNVDVNGSYAYVAAGSAGLQVVDVSDHLNPRIVASTSLAGNANDVVVVGNQAYVAGGTAGLHVVDISNPLAPALSSSLNTGGEAWGLVVKGTTAYMASGTAGLVIVDVSSPGSPELVGALRLPGTSKGVDIDPIRQVAVVALGANGIATVDVSDSSAPALFGILPGGDVRDIAVSGNYAFLADITRSFTSVDITDPTAPILQGSTPSATGGLLQDVAVRGRLAVGADVFFVNGVPVIDVSSPASPQPRAIIDFRAFRDDNGTGIALDTNYVYLTAEAGSISENGVNGMTRLYIGQYQNLQDTLGVPPAVQITAPADGATVVEGTPVTIAANAIDDVGVASVDFIVNGAVVFTATTAPYEYTFTAPSVPSKMTVGATATDFGGNVGVATNIGLTVIPDPLTTVTGRVVMSDQPVAGATVTVLGTLSAVSMADGTFAVSGVPTTRGALRAVARTTIGGAKYSGLSPAVSPVLGGTTVVGDITLTADPLVPALSASFFTDAPAVPFSVNATEIVLRKELNGVGNYGQTDGAADILYTGQAATWHFTIPAPIDPASVRSAYVRISVVADDHGSGAAGYTANVWTDDDFQFADFSAVPHGSPVGSHFTNWVQINYPLALASTMTLTVANTSLAGSGDWLAVDWIELHLEGAKFSAPTSGEAYGVPFSVLNSDVGASTAGVREAYVLPFSTLNLAGVTSGAPVNFEAAGLPFSVLNADATAPLGASANGSGSTGGQQVAQEADAVPFTVKNLAIGAPRGMPVVRVQPLKSRPVLLTEPLNFARDATGASSERPKGTAVRRQQ